MIAAKRKTKRQVRRSGLAVGLKPSENLPMVEAVMQMSKRGFVMVSNRRMNDSLSTDEWRQVEAGFPCRTGTAVGYEEPDKPLGKSIQFTDPETKEKYGFPVPEEHRGRRNIVLVAEHPHFTLSRVGRIMTVLASEVGVVENFPGESGWYLPDLRYGIPHGKQKTDRTQAARKLWRNEGSMVTLVVREAGDNESRHIGLRGRPSFADLGAIVDQSKGGAPKSETRITADGVLLTGLTVAQFTGLLAEAQDNYEALCAKLPRSALQGIRRLLDALKLK